MLVLYVLLTHVIMGSCITLLEDLCYGGTYTLPTFFAPRIYNKTITYTPKVGEPKIVFNHGKSLDARFRIGWGPTEMTGITEHDNEAVLSIEAKFFNSVQLRVRNCGSPVRKRYGSFIYWKIPFGAEYLEFVKYNGSGIPSPVEASILWNRTDPFKLKKGQISDNDYEIKSITQQDSGYYRFRGSKHQLLKWDQIVIENYVKDYDFDEGDIRLEFPAIFTPSQVKFKHEDFNPRILSNNRYKITDRYFAIEDAAPQDSGMYEFLDKEGNLMLRARVEIREVERVWVSYVFLACVSFGGLLCCCCVTKWCGEKSSGKTEETEDEAAVSIANHHNPNQSTQTTTPLLPREPSVVISDPPMYNAADGRMDLPPPYEECVTEPSAPVLPAYFSQPENPPPPVGPTALPPDPPPMNDVMLPDVNPSPLDQVSTTGTTGPTFSSSNNFYFTSSDSEPRFELSGTTCLPSAPPLSSEDSTSIQYDSDKINFL